MTLPIYAVVGPDLFLQTEEIRRIVREELGAHDGGLGPTRVDGKQAQPAEVFDEVRTFSLLGDRRVVIVDDGDAFIRRCQRKEEEKAPSEQEKKPEPKPKRLLENYCEAPADTGCLILCCESIDARTKLYKAIQKIGRIVRCETPKGKDLTDWILGRVRDTYGKNMKGDCAVSLRELAGNSLGELDNELAKLALYVGSRAAITTDDLEAVVGNHRHRKVFLVMDAIVEGNPDKALHYWERVLATERAAEEMAIGGLAWSVRRVVDAAQALAAGVSAGEIEKKYWITPQVLKRFPPDRLETMLRDLLDADLRTKTGLSDVPKAVEKFIVKHAVVDHP